jgi:hypothetical protein
MGGEFVLDILGKDPKKSRLYVESKESFLTTMHNINKVFNSGEAVGGVMLTAGGIILPSAYYLISLAFGGEATSSMSNSIYPLLLGLGLILAADMEYAGGKTERSYERPSSGNSNDSSSSYKFSLGDIGGKVSGLYNGIKGKLKLPFGKKSKTSSSYSAPQRTIGSRPSQSQVPSTQTPREYAAPAPEDRDLDELVSSKNPYVSQPQQPQRPLQNEEGLYLRLLNDLEEYLKTPDSFDELTKEAMIMSTLMHASDMEKATQIFKKVIPYPNSVSFVNEVVKYNNSDQEFKSNEAGMYMGQQNIIEIIKRAQQSHKETGLIN